MPILTVPHFVSLQINKKKQGKILPFKLFAVKLWGMEKPKSGVLTIIGIFEATDTNGKEQEKHLGFMVGR